MVVNHFLHAFARDQSHNLSSDFSCFQKVAECTNRSEKLLEVRTYDAAENALDAITEALSISPYSERLLKMKAEFLFMVCALSAFSFACSSI